MRKAKLQAATLGGNPDDIEAAFYDALRQGDIERLMACWADEEEIVCVHPGGPRLIGSGAIRDVLTTNVYHKTPQGWRMVAHHASPGTPNAPDEVSSSPSVLH